jgi:hypothetical protein
MSAAAEHAVRVSDDHAVTRLTHRVCGRSLAEQRDHVETELTAAVRAARRANRCWSEIGAMLGVSKQAAHRKYGHSLST